jgi:fatty-acyl-CoA synthase
MLGLMQDFPLTIEAILRHRERMYGAKTIVTQQAQGSERITLSVWPRPTLPCRWCRCSTPWPGVCPTPR